MSTNYSETPATFYYSGGNKLQKEKENFPLMESLKVERMWSSDPDWRAEALRAAGSLSECVCVCVSGLDNNTCANAITPLVTQLLMEPGGGA